MTTQITDEAPVTEDGATHLLIRQFPASELHVGELCPQTIPVVLQANEENCTQNSEDSDPGSATTDQLKVANLEEFMDVVTTYKCKFCPFSCKWKSGLVSHIRNTHLEVGVQRVGCQMQQQYSGEKDDSSSLMDTSQNSPTFLFETVLNPQLDSNPEQPATNEKQIFLCGQCNKGFNTLDQCKAHMVEDHQVRIETTSDTETSRRMKKVRTKKANEVNDVNDEKEFAGTVSKRKVHPPKLLEDDFVLNRKRKRHQWYDDRNYRCEECGCKFKTEGNLQYHEKCHQSGVKHLTCPECNENTENWRLLSLHLWKQHGVDMELYACSECQYRTYSSFKLENHRRIHSEERSFVCSTCGKGFKQVSQLRNHSIVHMDRKNMTEKRWYSEQKCDICFRTFSDSKCLRKHLQAVHSKLKPYVCSYCGHTSARKAMLQLHMRQHTGEKPFQCDQCEYRTGDHNSLRRHKMRHSGTKPYKCAHCAYACIQAISYKTHLKNKHPGMEGLFACPTCSFRSVSKDNYLNHMADHKRGAIPDSKPNPTSENPLPCGNMAAAQIIYSCLNALTSENGLDATSAPDGTRTFTIQIPAEHEMQDDEHYYLAIQEPTDICEGEIKGQQLTVSDATGDAIQVSTQPQHMLKTVRLIANGDTNNESSALSLPLVITES